MRTSKNDVYFSNRAKKKRGKDWWDEPKKNDVAQFKTFEQIFARCNKKTDV